MGVLDDPRVKRDTSVSDEMYNITTPDGIWDVALDDKGWLGVAPPNEHPEGYHGSSVDSEAYDAWFASLPRFGTAVDAVASILDRY